MALANVNTFPNNGRQSETTIAINPTDSNNIIAGANIVSAGTVTTGAAVNGAVAIFFSTDGGLRWSQANQPPAFTTNKGNNFSSSTDPWIDFDNSGNAFCAYLISNLDPIGNPTLGALVVSKSTDKGNTWGAPVAIVDHTGEDANAGSEDKETMAIDKNSGTTKVTLTTGLTDCRTFPLSRIAAIREQPS